MSGAPRPTRQAQRWRPAAVVLAAAVVLVVACTSEADPSGLMAGGPATAVPADPATAAFCDQWEAARVGGDANRLEALVADLPPGLAARTSSTSPQVLADIDGACHPALGTPGGGPDDRRVAPPLDAMPAGLTVCWAGPAIGFTPEDGGVVLYGERTRSDPYDGPMLGLVWGPRTPGFGGDGPATAVRVRGTDGRASPITVFQQVVLPELGTQVEWQEGDLSIAVYGRRWGDERVAELVALADSLEVVDGAVRLPEAALPVGYTEVFAGSPSDLSLVFVPRATYEVSSSVGVRATGQVRIAGVVGSAAELEAFRFLTLDLERSTTGERTTIAGNAWSVDDGPAVVTWRDPDGLIVRVVGLGVDLATVEAVADASRDLSAEEWGALVERSGSCPDASSPPPIDGAFEPTVVPTVAGDAGP